MHPLNPPAPDSISFEIGLLFFEEIDKTIKKQPILQCYEIM